MKVALVSESFLPTINGVTTSVCRVLDHLAESGHEAMIIAPYAGAPREYAGFPVHQVPAVAYRRFPVGLPSPQVQRLLEDFQPDVLHAASPFLLGGHALSAARKAGIPSVAIYQTDVAGYAKRNKLGMASKLAWQFVRRVHENADRTLAPSTSAAQDCLNAGIPRLALWGRGVDIERYHPRNRLRPSAIELRQRLTAGDRTVIGYVGRIAPEKQVERLAELAGMPNTTIAIVGDGPSEPLVRRALRGQHVVWLGRLSGDALADAYSAFDLFVHTGTEETFGQTIQEAQASSLPVIAPRAGGPIDLVDPGLDGLLFEPDEAGSLRRSVELLAEAPAVRARWGEAGRRKVLGRSWSGVCDDLLGHYRDVIGSVRPAVTETAPAPR